MVKKEKKPTIEKAASSLVRAQDVDTDPEWAIEPVGSPEEFGFPEKSTLQQRECWRNQERFLAAFRECCRIGDAAEAIGLTRWAVERWGAKDLYGFKKRMAAAEQGYLEKLEAEADRRGVEGIDHPVIHQGKITATYKQYSDNLLMFRMKRLQPEYRDNYSDKPESGATPVTQIIINLAPRVEKLEQVVEATEYRELPEEDKR